MSLYYESQDPAVLVGSKTSAGSRTSVLLTANYDETVSTKAIATGSYSKINIDILYTMGATETTNTIQMRAECSSDGVNFYRIPNETVSGGTSTLAAREFTFVGADAAAATISIGLDIFYKFMRFSFKESAVVTNFGTVFAEYTLSGK